MPEKSQISGMLLGVVTATVACTPSPQDTTMRSQDQAAESTRQSSSNAASDRPVSATVGPIPEAVPVTENPLPGTGDSPAEAQGRRTLTTAFVQVGPDGHLAVDLRDGRTIVLRNVIMRASDYCGVQASGATAGKKYCGNYADVAAARPGGGPAFN